jgi:hypothetical protein
VSLLNPAVHDHHKKSPSLVPVFVQLTFSRIYRRRESLKSLRQGLIVSSLASWETASDWCLAVLRTRQVSSHITRFNLFPPISPPPSPSSSILPVGCLRGVYCDIIMLVWLPCCHICWSKQVTPWFRFDVFMFAVTLRVNGICWWIHSHPGRLIMKKDKEVGWEIKPWTQRKNKYVGKMNDEMENETKEILIL